MLISKEWSLPYTKEFLNITDNPLWGHTSKDDYHTEDHLFLVGYIAAILAKERKIQHRAVELAGYLHDYQHQNHNDDFLNIEHTIDSVCRLYDISGLPLMKTSLFQNICKCIRYTTQNNPYNTITSHPDPEFGIMRDADLLAGIIADNRSGGRTIQSLLGPKTAVYVTYLDNQLTFLNNLNWFNAEIINRIFYEEICANRLMYYRKRKVFM